jgi:hypothetical protein
MPHCITAGGGKYPVPCSQDERSDYMTMNKPDGRWTRDEKDKWRPSEAVVPMNLVDDQRVIVFRQDG